MHLSLDRRLAPSQVYRYWIEFRQAFTNSNQIAISTDDSRFSGSSYAAGPVMDLRSGITGWPPVKELSMLTSAAGNLIMCPTPWPWPANVRFCKVLPAQALPWRLPWRLPHGCPGGCVTGRGAAVTRAVL